MTTTFGTVLRTARARAGLTRRQLAERVGCHASYVSVLERGKRGVPSEQMCVALARECAVRPDVLLVAAARMPCEKEMPAMTDQTIATLAAAESARAELVEQLGIQDGELAEAAAAHRLLAVERDAADAQAHALRADVERLTAERDALRWHIKQLPGGMPSCTCGVSP